jgi:hypothetical protein
MATRLRRRGISLLVQSHSSWVDLGRLSFWITLQISQFMVRSSFPVVFVNYSFGASIHHCSITLGLPIYSLQFLPSRVGFMPGIPADIQTMLQARYGRKPAASFFSRVVELTGIQRRPGDK